MRKIIQRLRWLVTTPSYQLAAALVILCLVLQFGGYSDTLRFDRQAIDNGRWWLLLTGNFVHLGNSHLWMNLAGLMLVVALVWPWYSASQWLLIMLFSSALVGNGLYLLDPDVHWYVGFSGTLHGLLLAGCLADFKHYPKSAALLLLLVVAKLIWEQLSGALPGSESVAGGKVVVNAHLYGAIGGAIAGAVLLLRGKRKHS